MNQENNVLAVLLVGRSGRPILREDQQTLDQNAAAHIENGPGRIVFASKPKQKIVLFGYTASESEESIASLYELRDQIVEHGFDQITWPHETPCGMVHGIKARNYPEDVFQESVQGFHALDNGLRTHGIQESFAAALNDYDADDVLALKEEGEDCLPKVFSYEFGHGGIGSAGIRLNAHEDFSGGGVTLVFEGYTELDGHVEAFDSVEATDDYKPLIDSLYSEMRKVNDDFMAVS